MSREIRRVADNWQHPINQYGIPKGLLKNYTADVKVWEKHIKQWEKGLKQNIITHKWGPISEEEKNISFEESNWGYEKPDQSNYMPEWTEEEKTHIQIYETTSEGTPVSPKFKVDEFEKLCEWAAENVSTFADKKTTKENWMRMLGKGLVATKIGGIIFM